MLHACAPFHPVLLFSLFRLQRVKDLTSRRIGLAPQGP